MTHHSFRRSVLGATLALSLAACREKEAPSAPAPSAVPAPASAPIVEKAAAASSSPAIPAAPKADKIDPAQLKAGLALMQPRVLAKVEGMPNAKMEPTQRSRFFMHPGHETPSSIEFDTKGLSSLTLAPFIEDFGGSADCVNKVEAGVARVTWWVDGAKKGQVMVDRHYNDVLDVNLGKSSKLKIEVDKGNAVPWCDWVSVGFLNVR